MRFSTAAAVTALLTAALAAQDFPPPPGWKWVTDTPAQIVSGLEPADGQWLFGTMAPGWHITTRPGVILFEPTYSGRGRYVVESEMFLFPGASQSGFGILVGGADLEGAGRRYVAFLIRRDGSAAIERYESGKPAALHSWARADGVAPHPGGNGTARNVIRVEVEAASAAFLVNGKQVAETPRIGDALDGTIGLRIGPDVNIHVTNLDITHRLALPRPAK